MYHRLGTLAQLTQNFGYFFEARKKTVGIFVDLIVAYDTVWHRNGTNWPHHLGAALWVRLFGRQLTVKHSHLDAIRFGASQVF